MVEMGNILPEDIGVFELDTDGRFLKANLAALTAFGYGEEDLKTGLSIFHVLEEKEHQRARENLQKLLSGGSPGPGVYRVRRKNGSPATVLVEAALYPWPVTPRIRGLVIDITEKPQGIRILETARHFYRDIVECSPVGIYVTSLEGKLLFLNDAGCLILGFSSPQEASRTPVPSLYRHPEEREKLIELLKRDARVINFTPEVVRPSDGKVIRISLFAHLEGELICGTFVDITETYQLKEALQKKVEEQEQLIQDTIFSLSRVMEIRDSYTANHQTRMTDLACLIARELDFPEERVKPIFLSGLVHDIGKIGVPSQILTKIGQLNVGELALIRTHPVVSYRILQPVHFTSPVPEIVRQHHERLDGSGYPQGLRGDNILIEARILSVADVVEAMSSHRPYRPALGLERALKEITDHRGTWFDPKAVDACLAIFKKGLFKLE
ncbi:MAG: PAS domain S-box protein [Candidatus Omnitrophica bacterium]|nr:PAS domain S-box protein [Candidatus Omnitrophota bacterium]